MISGRFEWLSIPEDNSAESIEVLTEALPSKTCPHCGWVDSAAHYMEISNSDAVFECFRCGVRFDVSQEIAAFFSEEQVALPPIQFIGSKTSIKQFFKTAGKMEPRLFDLRLRAAELCLRKGYDNLLSLQMANIDQFDHQIKTAMTVLKKMRCRALLADEVGMGKTVEAGIILKEQIIRGIASAILILAPATLTHQWKEELLVKFNEKFQVFKGHHIDEKNPRVISSYDTAKRREHLQNINWDIVVLDEAHRLKNRSTEISKFVKGLKSRFLLALTATPIQNSLNELFAIVDLINPGKLGTIRAFRRAFVSPSNPREIIKGKEAALQQSLSDVMIRNRRDASGIKLPKRRCAIYYISPSPLEKKLYDEVSTYVKTRFKQEFLKETGLKVHQLSLIILQRELMSSPAAVKATLSNIASRKGYPLITKNRLESFIQTATEIKTPSKIAALRELINLFNGNRIIVFTEFIASLKSIVTFLREWGLTAFEMSGQVSTHQRAAILEDFRKTQSAVLVCTEVAGVGLNLQCCHHLINYDLPWNPMKVEQRIGRIDRIGQRRDVNVVNLVCENTIEEYVVDILAKKLRMFELVVGSMSTVLGYMEKDKTFEQMVVDVFFSSESPQKEKEKFSALAEKMVTVRNWYDRDQLNNHVLNSIGKTA